MGPRKSRVADGSQQDARAPPPSRGEPRSTLNVYGMTENEGVCVTQNLRLRYRFACVAPDPEAAKRRWSAAIAGWIAANPALVDERVAKDLKDIARQKGLSTGEEVFTALEEKLTEDFEETPTLLGRAHENDFFALHVTLSEP